VAAAMGHLKVVQWLHSQGVDLNQAANFGETPMHLAAGCGSEECVSWLLEQAPLHYAASNGHLLVTHLLVQCGASLTWQDMRGRSVFAIAQKNTRFNLLASVLSQTASYILEAMKYREQVRTEVQPMLKTQHQHTNERLARLKEAEQEQEQEQEGGSASKAWIESEGVVQHAARIGIDEARLRRLPPLVRPMRIPSCTQHLVTRASPRCAWCIGCLRPPFPPPGARRHKVMRLGARR
jgi:hypothetical protein